MACVGRAYSAWRSAWGTRSKGHHPPPGLAFTRRNSLFPVRREFSPTLDYARAQCYACADMSSHRMVRLDAELYDRLSAQRVETGVPIAEQLRRLVSRSVPLTGVSCDDRATTGAVPAAHHSTQESTEALPLGSGTVGHPEGGGTAGARLRSRVSASLRSGQGPGDSGPPVGSSVAACAPDDRRLVGPAKAHDPRCGCGLCVLKRGAK